MDKQKTDVVLVVKGAGLHKPDDTLDFFLKGFLPGVKSIDPDAEVRQVSGKDIFEGFPTSPHTEKPHHHLTEILLNADKEKTSPRRIWVKEIYWENELTPSNPWKAFFVEWKMASYALRRDVTLFFSWLILKFLGLKKTKSESKNENDLKTATNAEENTIPAWANPLFLFASFVLIYFSFGLFFFESFLARYSSSILETSFIGKLIFPNFNTSSSYIFLIIAAFVMAIDPALSSIRYFHSKQLDRGDLPGLQKWIMLLLVASFLFFTLEYLGLIVVSIVPVLLINFIRSLLWKRRPQANTDFPIEKALLPTGEEIPVTVPVLKIYYRFVVVLALPILFFLILLSKFFKWTKILGAFGEGLEIFLNRALGGILGDVSTYAMDPSQRYRVKSVIEDEISFFHKKGDVDNIHIFAHSQGTAITFEVLYQQLAQEKREKIKTYVTVGSILSYYHQTAPILETTYPPTRFRLTKYPSFALNPSGTSTFQWVNCWNLLDPITEFYGLNEFHKDNDIANSPKNIKTRALFHSDYWINIHEVHIPFINHILDIDNPNDFWKKNQRKPQNAMSQKRYSTITTIIFWIFLAMAVSVFLYLYTQNQPITLSITNYVDSIFDTILKSLESSSPDSFFSNLRETATWATFKKLGEWLTQNISDILMTPFAAYLVYQFFKSISKAKATFHLRKTST